jgi:protein-disulfide isomerase
MEEEVLTKKQRRDLKRQQKLEDRDREARSAKRNKLLTFLVIIIVVIGVGVLLVMAGNNGDGDVVTNDYADPTLGTAEAAVVVEEYSDFQCPACASAEPVVKDLIDQYGDRISFAYNDFPLTNIHSNAKNAAIAGQCALAQGKFWELHDLFFDRQLSWEGKSRSEAVNLFKEYAGEVGLDQALFDACLDNKDTEKAVDEDISEARSRSVNSTPTFFINGERVVGGADLISTVESALGI